MQGFSTRQIANKQTNEISNLKCLDSWYKLDCRDLLMNQADLLPTAWGSRRGAHRGNILFLFSKSDLKFTVLLGTNHQSYTFTKKVVR